MRAAFFVLAFGFVACTEPGEPSLTYEDVASDSNAPPEDTSDTHEEDVDVAQDTDSPPPEDVDVPDTDTPPSLTYTGDILPLLRQAGCLGCHSGSRPQAGLGLSTFDALMLGGDSGPVVKPCAPHESLLTQVIVGDDCEMPPFGACMSQPHLEVIRTWIERGEEFSAHCL